MAFVPRSVEKIKELIELTFEQGTQYIILVGDTLANPHIFAEWELTKEGTLPDNFFYMMDIVLQSVMRVSSGAANVRFAVLISDDGVTWGTITGGFNNTNSASATALISNTDRFNAGATTRFIAIAAFNTDGATAGELSRFKAHVLSVLPFGDSITRII